MEVVLKISNLNKFFPIRSESLFERKRWNKALENINLEVYDGEALGVVGESGSGKTTLGKCILGLHDLTSGQVDFFSKNEEKQNFSVVFQDPFTSLNPRMTIFDIIKEPLEASKKKFEGESMRQTILETLEKVGLAEEHMFRYPHEFSGGQRQRIAIARAIVSKPELIIFDEPTSGLDVSVQAQILNILKQMRNDYKFSYIFISHNLGVIRYICSRIVVLYRGRVVEIAEREDLFNNPLHPYTKKLLKAVPDIRKFGGLDAEEPSEEESFVPKSEGCTFASECPIRKDICLKEFPKEKVLENNHIVYCWEYN